MNIQDEYISLIKEKDKGFNKEIRKFWENQTFDIKQSYPINFIKNSKWCICWVGITSYNYFNCVAVSETISDLNISKANILYSFGNHKLISEEDALRFIKLKAFI